MIKIVLGLVQVVSKQPEVLKADYPGIMWDSEWLKVFAFDFSWVVRLSSSPLRTRHQLNHNRWQQRSLTGTSALCAQVPVCEVSYPITFLLNTVLLPLTLIGLVASTWATNKRADAKPSVQTKDTTDDYDEIRASKYSDYYFAIFLSCELRVTNHTRSVRVPALLCSDEFD